MKKRIIAIVCVLTCIYLCLGAVNVTQVPGATEIIFYLRNYLFSTAVSSQPSGTLCLYTSINQLGYKDFSGNIYKTLNDASDSGITPGSRMWFADSSGAAENDTGFYYDTTSNNLYVDSSIVHHYGKSSVFVTNGAYDGEMYVNSSGTVFIIATGDTVLTLTDEPL